MSDLYGVLGLSRRADGAEIKAAFRKLAKTCHPDLHAGDRLAEQRFKEIGNAYETLGDTDARARYDQAIAQRRARRRRAYTSMAATMVVSFMLTVSSGLVLGAWLIAEARF
jgi:curved DNA-binding protein CbpA